MSTRFRWVCILGFTIAGCGGPAGPKASSQENEQALLAEVGQLYQLYTAAQNKPPEKTADFTSSQAAFPQGYEAIRSGQIIVHYGAKMTDLEEGPPKGESNEILAYEKQVPESGGQVLMLNRKVKTMTSEEFKAAKKAGKG